MFIAEIVSVSADDSLMDEKGRLCLENADLIAYSHGQYMAMNRNPIGRFGYSVMKPKTKKRLAEQQKNTTPQTGTGEESKLWHQRFIRT